MKNQRIPQLSCRLAISMPCLVIALLLASPVGAQPESPKAGISALLQDDQGDIAVVVRWEKFTLAASVGLLHVSDAVTDYGFGIAARFHTRSGKAVPYIGFRSAILVLEPSPGESMIDFAVGPSLGGEYFLDDHFSLGAEAQLNFTISDEHSNRFANPGGENVNTATSLMATFYF